MRRNDPGIRRPVYRSVTFRPQFISLAQLRTLFCAFKMFLSNFRFSFLGLFSPPPALVISCWSAEMFLPVFQGSMISCPCQLTRRPSCWLTEMTCVSVFPMCSKCDPGSRHMWRDPGLSALCPQGAQTPSGANCWSADIFSTCVSVFHVSEGPNHTHVQLMISWHFFYCGDIVVYVVAFNPRKILLINPTMGWRSKSGNSDVWRKSSNCIIVSWFLWAVE
jgi:hypothetical protein